MTNSITITTGARLHFGLVVRGDADRRRYGGVGLMVDRPGYTLTVQRAEQDRILAAPATIERIEQFLMSLRKIDDGICWQVEVREQIPAHAGLGSGTQLGLALATAVNRLSDEENCSANESARRLGRGTRSAIGTIGFDSGGLILDGGKPAGSDFAVPTGRHNFPDSWRFVLVTPTEDQGISGDQERTIFRDAPAMTPLQLTRLCLLIIQDLLPAVADRDFAGCSTALYDFGRQVGEYFAPIQGGIYANVRMAVLAEKLRLEGITGVGQTSWGPTLFALCDTEQSAQQVAEDLKRSTSWCDCTVHVVGARNRGAAISGDASRPPE